MLNILPALLMMFLYGPNQSDAVNPLLRAEVIRIVLQSERFEQRQEIATNAPLTVSRKERCEVSSSTPVLQATAMFVPQAVFTDSLRPRDGPTN
ncbi:MAG: hypothetical protein K8R88_11675 [Armatimonadetes bacterium]|nr:hypothetical protein [Armatimonadota bacterium]